MVEREGKGREGGGRWQTEKSREVGRERDTRKKGGRECADWNGPINC